MAAKWIKLEDYGVSPTTGFVPDEPLLRLPDYFSPWEKLCAEIPQMVKDGTARALIEKLPLLDVSSLSSEKEWNRAHLVLTDLASTYVWGEGKKNPAKVLPKCVAVPLITVSGHLDLPPAVIYSSQVLYNWRKTGPGNGYSDIKMINKFSTTNTEDGFFVNALLVELEFGKGGPQAIIDGQQAVLDDDINQLITQLTKLQEVIKNMTSQLVTVHDVADPKEFFFLFSPFLTGWGKGTPLEDGLIFEGVSTEPIQCITASAAQNSIFPCIDGFLGLKHKTEDGEEHYLRKIRKHIPSKYRAFIAAIENGPSVKSYVLQKNDSVLTEKYNGCLDATKEFRNQHINAVVRFVITQANKDPEFKGFKAGTGPLPMLKKVRSETAEAKI